MKKYNVLFYILIFYNSCKKENDTPVNTSSDDYIKYEAVFTFNWNDQDFPNRYPSNPHFSKLIGWSHQPSTTLFQVGTMSTEGIKQMAELGNTSPLDLEITDSINSKLGYQLIIGNNLDSGVGTITVEILVNKQNSAVTLATMLAPSPDWFVAAINVNLLENGIFITEKTVDAFVYDAGTDSGVSFNSKDSISSPQQAIHLLILPPLGDSTSVSPVIATLKLTKKN